MNTTMTKAASASNFIEKNPPWSLERTPLDRSATQLTADSDEHLRRARALRETIVNAPAPRTIDNTLAPYNHMIMHLDAAAAEANLFARVHPDAAVRDAAEQSEQTIAQYLTELSLDRELFDAFRAFEGVELPPDTRWFVEKRLRDFRRGGVDKPEPVRDRIRALSDELVRIGQDFSRNTRDDERELAVDSIADLDGLPQDWIDKHRPAADGKTRVSTRTPDYAPIMTYAKSPNLRRTLYQLHKDRAHPKNLEVLGQLLGKRHELAQLLGYATWADYVTEDKMVQTASSAAAFIDRVAAIGEKPSRREYDILLARKREDTPAADRVEDWERGYLEQLVRTEQYAFDAQAARPFFNFTDVQRGILDLTGRLFGLTYRRVDGLKLWHKDVTAWDILDGGEPLGRFYLDLFPRENKYGHAAQFDYRTGLLGERLPQAVLVCNFPNPNDAPDGLALMEHNDVVTFFHEFGHLLHHLLAGRQRWIGNSGISTEWDFVEVPSQLLEEWCFDLESLRVFAKHHRTGEPIPAQLVANLCRSREFGKGLQVRHQMFYAAVALNYYNRDPAGLDTTTMLKDMQRRYSAFDYVEGTHFQCSFGHLDGYSAIYYTYMWSLVIVRDVLGEFQRQGMLDPTTARRFRETILEPGGSRKASELIESFLGRPYRFEALETWLNRAL